MAASNFSCNFFRTLTSRFEQCGEYISMPFFMVPELSWMTGRCRNRHSRGRGWGPSGPWRSSARWKRTRPRFGTVEQTVPLWREIWGFDSIGNFRIFGWIITGWKFFSEFHRQFREIPEFWVSSFLESEKWEKFANLVELKFQYFRSLNREKYRKIPIKFGTCSEESGLPGYVLGQTNFFRFSS